MPLVRLFSMQKIELFSAFFDRSPNSESHGDESHAAFFIVGIEAGLIEVEFVPVEEPIQRCSGLSVQVEDEKPQPALSECDLRKFLMKAHQLRGMESVRRSSTPPPQVVQS